MLRTGIYKLDQLRSHNLNDIFGREKNISIKLYNILMKENASEGDYESLSEITLNRFNTKSNAIKRTYRNRFNNFDLACLEYIDKLAYSKIAIHDMAISDGRASQFFLTNIKDRFPNAAYTGSDIAITYTSINVPNTLKSYIVHDEKNNIIEITKPPFVWNYERKEGPFYFLNNLLKGYYLKKYSSLITSSKDLDKTQIKLCDREFQALIDSNTMFNVKNHDLFEAPSGSYNIIRVMNILHYGYFKKEQLQRILFNLHKALETNGLLIEGSNENPNSPVEGGIYQKTPVGFQMIHCPEKKSRISDIIVDFRQ